jgi:hypothetical protein
MASCSSGEYLDENYAYRGSNRKQSFIAQNDSILSHKKIEVIPEIVEIHSKPIFKLFKGFKLQQYAIVKLIVFNIFRK